MTDEEKRIKRLYWKTYREQMTPEQRQRRLERMSQRQKERLAQETLEQRQRRLAQYRAYRQRKKEQHNEQSK